MKQQATRPDAAAQAGANKFAEIADFLSLYETKPGVCAEMLARAAEDKGDRNAFSRPQRAAALRSALQIAQRRKDKRATLDYMVDLAPCLEGAAELEMWAAAQKLAQTIDVQWPSQADVATFYAYALLKAKRYQDAYQITLPVLRWAVSKDLGTGTRAGLEDVCLEAARKAGIDSAEAKGLLAAVAYKERTESPDEAEARVAAAEVNLVCEGRLVWEFLNGPLWLLFDSQQSEEVNTALAESCGRELRRQGEEPNGPTPRRVRAAQPEDKFENACLLGVPVQEASKVTGPQDVDATDTALKTWRGPGPHKRGAEGSGAARQAGAAPAAPEVPATCETQAVWVMGGKVYLLYDASQSEATNKALDASCARALAALMQASAGAVDRFVRVAYVGEVFENAALLGTPRAAGKALSPAKFRAANDAALRACACPEQRVGEAQDGPVAVHP